MKIVFTFIMLILMAVGSAYSADCPAGRYTELIQQGKAAETGREWERVADLYSNILTECRLTIPAADLPKAYDSLSSAQLMLNKYHDALESCEKCIALDNRYNACMMTAARVHDALGDTLRAIESAKNAASVEPNDEYSAAVSILANDFLRHHKQK